MSVPERRLRVWARSAGTVSPTTRCGAATGGDRLAAADRGRTAQRSEAAGTDPRLLGVRQTGHPPQPGGTARRVAGSAPHDRNRRRPAGAVPHTAGIAAARRVAGRPCTAGIAARREQLCARPGRRKLGIHPTQAAPLAGSPSRPTGIAAALRVGPARPESPLPAGSPGRSTHNRNRRGPPGCRSAPHGRNRGSPGTTLRPSGAPQTRHPPHPGSATHRLPPHTTGTTAARRTVADRNFRPAGHRPPPNHDRRAALKPLSLPPLPRTPPPPRAACGSRPATSSPAVGTLPPR